MSTYHIHLVSDSTGETVSSVSRSAMAQFENIEVEEHAWSLIRTKGQVDKVIEGIKHNRGFVMYTLSDKKLRNYLTSQCVKLKVPHISVLSRVVADLSSFLGIKATVSEPGKRHELDDEYFSRVEAVNFALTHDDGQSVWDLEEADIILTGVSRTSKSPTSMYLAFKGFRTANVPYVPNVPFPINLEEDYKHKLIVALTINPEILGQIRKNRILSLNETNETDYVNIEKIKKEILEAKKYFLKNSWPVLDVTRKSVEETSAAIVQLYNKKMEIKI